MAGSISDVGEAARAVAQEAIHATVSVGKRGLNIAIDAGRATIGEVIVKVSPTIVTLYGMHLGFKILSKIIDGVLCRGIGVEEGDANAQNIQPGGLHFLLNCSTDERFLAVLNDFKTGRMKARLELEFRLAGIILEGLKVNIENIQEVEEMGAAINAREHCVMAGSQCEVESSSQSAVPEAHSTDSGGDLKIIIDTERINLSGASIPSGSASSLHEIYKNESNAKKIYSAVKRALGLKYQEIRVIQPKCLYVLLHCFTDIRFLEVLDDFNSGKMKQRLQMEFSFIGIQTERLVVNIENIEEVEERAAALSNIEEPKHKIEDEPEEGSLEHRTVATDAEYEESLSSNLLNYVHLPPQAKEEEAIQAEKANHCNEDYLTKHSLKGREGKINEDEEADKCKEGIKATSVVEFANDQDKNISGEKAQRISCSDFKLGNSSKYSMKNIRRVDNDTLTDTKLMFPEQVPDYILKKLMIADYHAREFKLEPLNSDKDKAKKISHFYHPEGKIFPVDINPMDAMLEVFHSSDEYLREYLAIKLAACQLSVPLLLPDPTAPSQNVTILLSALKGITKTWKDSNQKNENAFATEYPFPVVSFLRIGQTMSKSSLMNKVMSDAIGYHNYFFQRGMKGGHYKRKTVDGLVELSWYLPAAKKIEQTLKNQICFANLRGDVRYFKKQFNLMLTFSSVLCLLLPSGDLEMTVTDVMNEAVKSKAKVILIFKEPCASDYFNDLERKYPGTFSFITKADKENKFEFLQSIRECIQQSLHQVKGTPLAELAKIAGKFGIFIDGNHQQNEVDAIVDSWLHQGIKEAKNHLALQKYVPALAVLEREKYSPKLRASKSKSDHTREEIMSEIYEDIEAEKGAQRESFEELDEKIVEFLISLTKMDQTERNRVLSGFKHQLDKMSLADMAKLHQEYHVSRRKEKTKTLQMSDAQSPNQDDLKNIEAQLSEFSFGLEHIIREIAQLHQLGISDYDYAGAAAEMLLSGQPIELLDGDSSYVPLPWFYAVYTKLQRKTNNAKIFVISVLGIQSSGKSTLLNTMFGLEFPVSAGRCTRGVFASLLPVSDSLRSASKFSYVLIIDTEGLRGSADPQLREHDNELATFTIGVSDITIVNILGANHDEMKEFLEIAVRAFLKMKLVNEKKTCKIVHQNVVATDATDQFIVERSNLKKDLDEMTKLAAREENCDGKFHKLNDIISFNESEDVFYIPGRLTGSPPMAPVNPEYGRAVQEVKENIISLMCSKEIFRYSISHFRDRVCTLWRAMLKENFILTFRNTMEVRAYTSLDRKYFQESVNVMVIGMKQLENRIEIALKRCTTNEELTNKWLKLEKGINREAEIFATKMRKAMINFIETSEDKAILEQWGQVIMNKIEQQKDLQVMEVCKDCKATFNHVRNLQDVKEKQKIYESELINKAREFITSAKNTEDTEKCKKAFDQEWQKWIQCVPPFQESRIHVEHEMKNVLRETDPHLKTEMSEKLDELKGLSLSSFEKEAPKIYVEQIGKQEKKIPSARIIRDKAIKEALNFAKTVSASGKKCTLYNFKHLYHKVSFIIEKESKKYSIKFSKDLKCDILLHVFGLTYKIFEEMQESYLQERNIRENLEKTLRPSLELRFLNLCETMEKGVRAATSFVDILKAPIKSHLNQWMGQAVAKQIIEDSVPTNEDQSNAEIVPESLFKIEDQSNEEVKHGNMFKSKGQFHACVLIELGEEGKFERYIPYLKNPTEFLKKKLTSSITNYCQNEGNASVNLLLKNTVKKIQSDVSSAISFAKNDTIAKDKYLTVWIQKFVEKCSSLPITKDMFTVVTIYDDPECVDLFKNSIDEKVKLLFEGLSTGGVNEEIFQNWKPSPDEYLLTSMFGCEKFCPFCKGLCDHTDKNHIGDHFTRIHRPEGISGYKYHQTKILCHSICTNCVANTKMTFYNADTDYKWHYYKDYRSVNEYYKSWNIPDDSSFEPSTYWQWFMATFSKDLADHYKVKEPEFPSHWKGHTFEKVKEDLQKEYKLVEN